MRILFLSSFYPPLERGGYEQMAHEVATRLARRGHDIHVLTSRYGVNGHAPPEREVSRILHLQADIDYYRPVEFFVKRRRQESTNALALRQTLDRFQPDLIFVWNMWNLSRMLPYWAEQWRPGRVAYYLSATWPADTDIHVEYWQLPANRRVSEWLKRPVRAHALATLRREGYPPPLRFEHVRCVSRFVRDTCIQAGQLPVNAQVLYTGIDPQPFLDQPRPPAPTEPLRLLYFGALLTIKGVHTAIEALGELKQRGLSDRIALTLIGSGHPDYEARLHALVDRYELHSAVHFAGRVPRDEVPLNLAQHDVYLFTSCGPEALARTVMEAMAAGLLVIGAETGGQVEMLHHGENALTFKAEDAIGLADQIERALNDPALRSRLAQAGRQTVLDRFTLDRMVDEIETWLESLR